MDATSVRRAVELARNAPLRRDDTPDRCDRIVNECDRDAVMSKKLYGPVLSLLALPTLGWIAGCFSSSSGPSGGDATNLQDSAVPQADAVSPLRDGGMSEDGSPGAEGGSQGAEGGSQGDDEGGSAGTDSSFPSWTYVLIDDMETTNHGPIEFDAGIDPPLTPGYWYNSGAQVGIDAGDGGDMSMPPQGKFEFTALAAPTTTLNGNISEHAARQFCVLTGLYDTCGVGFEFAQEPDPDAGVVDASGVDATVDDATVADAASDAGDAGDAGPSIPRITIPFDISRYKGITFWGMTTTPDDTGSLQVKVGFPDTDTDPRGEVCNGGGGDLSKCYNNYAAYLNFTTSWQQFIVLLDAGDGGVDGPPDGGIAIDSTWGYQNAQWIPTQVYGINWQGQKNTDPDAGPVSTDIWVDDVYFLE